MGLLRALFYCAIAGAILVGSPYFGPDGRVPSFRAGQAEAAPARQESPTVTPTSTLPSAPTPAASAVAPTTSATAGAGTQTPTPVATGTPTPTSTRSDETPTPTPTAIESVTPTSTPDPENIPADPDPIGTTTQLEIGANGGTLNTADGRVTLVVPANAVAASTNLSVTSRAGIDFPGLDSHRLIAVYELTATDVATGLEITTFPTDLSLTLHFSSTQMSNLLADSVHLWSLEPLTRTWVEVTTGAHHSGTSVTNTISHFSIYGGSGDPAISQGPFTVDFNTNLHSGSATGAIPIEVPAGPGGLTPQLVLNYDSNRVNDMKDSTSLASWV